MQHKLLISLVVVALTSYAMSLPTTGVEPTADNSHTECDQQCKTCATSCTTCFASCEQALGTTFDRNHNCYQNCDKCHACGLIEATDEGHDEKTHCDDECKHCAEGCESCLGNCTAWADSTKNRVQCETRCNKCHPGCLVTVETESVCSGDCVHCELDQEECLARCKVPEFGCRFNCGRCSTMRVGQSKSDAAK